MQGCLVQQPYQQEPTEDSHIIEYDLPNGTHVIMQPIHSAPVVALNVWVHVGSKDETDETRGLAHIQEHMLFQGTDSYAPGTIFKTVEGVGGSLNAYTGLDRTVYHITMPSENVGTGLDILGSMMHEALIEEESLTKELEVVVEEFRRSRDDPSQVLTEKLFATVFTQHPYQHPVIGYQPSIEGISRQQVMDFYNQWYVPENMTVVVVGDVDVEETKIMIAESFGAMEQKENPKREIPDEPQQEELRSVVVQEAFDNPQLKLGFPISAFENRDSPILDVMFTVLSHGRSSRLYKLLVEERQIVTGISASPYTPEEPGIALINAALTAENAAPALEEIIRELQRFKVQPVTTAELEKAKLQLESTFVYNQESFAGIARNLGSFHVIGGGTDSLDSYLEDIAAVSTEDIMRIAQKYFTPEQLTIGMLYPQEAENTLTGEELEQVATDAFAWLPEDSDDAPEEPAEESEADNADSSASATGAHIVSQVLDEEVNVTKVQFENGLSLLVREDHNVPVFVAQAVMLGGLRSETPETNGINSLISSLFTRGTESRTHEEIALELESMAASMGGFSGNNSVGLSAKGLSRHSSQILDVFTEALQKPSFAKDQLELVRTLTLDSIDRQSDSPTSIALKDFRSAMYGDHPFGMQAIGTTESVKSFTQNDLREFAGKNIHPQNLLVVVVGDVDTTEVITQIASSLGSWKPEHAYIPTDVDPPVFTDEIQTVHTADDKAQSNIYLGFPAIPLDHPDRFAFLVTNKILAGAGGRLFTELRDKQSLAYSVSSGRMEGYRDPGYFVVYIGCEPAKTNQAVDGIKSELQKMIDAPVSDAELEQAKAYLAGSYVIGLQSYSSQAQTMMFSERYGLGYDEYTKYVDNIRSVTKEDVQRIAREYFTLDRYVLSVVGPEAPEAPTEDAE